MRSSDFVERATLYAMTQRLWGSAAGLVTAALVASCFTPSTQGYYYTFLSLLTLQTFVDLGLGDLLQQFVSHEWARWDASSPSIRERALERLSTLLRFSWRWYGAASLVLAIGLGLLGSLYFRVFTPTDSLSWELAWWLASLATGASVLLTPAFSFLEGANHVDRVYGVKLGQGLSSRVGGFLAIFYGAGLYTVAITRWVAVATGLLGLGRNSRALLRRLGAPAVEAADAADRLSWRRELWPLQWKYALSWLSGYALYALFTPVLFAFHGPVVAGQMGMTVAAASAISSAAFAVVSTKVPRLALHAARGEFSHMDRLFRRATLSAIGVSLAGSVFLLALLFELRRLDATIALRFLPLPETALLLGAVVLQQLRFAMGSYLRAHKEEPLVALSVLEGLLAIPLLTLLGRSFGSFGMVLGFVGLTTATLVPAVRIFERCRLLWHRPWRAEASSEGGRWVAS